MFQSIGSRGSISPDRRGGGPISEFKVKEILEKDPIAGKFLDGLITGDGGLDLKF